MDKVFVKLTVFFDPPYWVGLYERQGPDGYAVCKAVFGPEPREFQVYDYYLKNWSLLRFGPAVAAAPPPDGPVSPKRLQRQIRKALEPGAVGTRAQQALALQRQEQKKARRDDCRRSRQEKTRQQFDLQQQKKKQKHRGH